VLELFTSDSSGLPVAASGWMLLAYSLFGMFGGGSGGLRFPMTSKALTWEDRLLISKFEALQPDPAADDPASLVFPFTREEADTVAWFWKKGLIEPTGVATAQFTRTGLEKVRHLRGQMGKLTMTAG
jgi:hypothetical protein